ncbi:hypothetical protein NUW54_g6827 [Trametes sanguinea]|uniref:Uncharacterized protein n=1 Tax=Trametes sanguinea TaxID=158606 RepID=A0ACC1PT79_9APHY|nr:hypothetical protein NUW54_g6827 [Trametes sanguinea]
MRNPHALLQLTLAAVATARTLTVVNSCSYTVWPAILSNAGSSIPNQPTGWEQNPQQTISFSIPNNWAGQLWGRRDCDPPRVESNVLHGFAGTFNADALNALRANPDVEYIAEDGIVHINAAVTQTNAPWGLQRISQTAKLSSQNTNALTYTYTYDSTAGSGVDIYIVDTGIYTAHSEFGGRARWGATFGGYANADGNGHGTHVSGTAAGATYGVAKKANLIAVKVLSDQGSGSVSDMFVAYPLL